MLTFTFLQEATGSAAQGTPGGGMGSMLLMIGALFLVMYFFMIRPQQKKQKQLREMRNQLQKGDKVITAGGIYGTINEIKDQYVLLEIDNNVKIRVDRSTIYKDNSDLQQQQK